MPDTSTPPERTSVLAVDPGRSKCGLAVVSTESVLVREIVATEAIGARAAELIECHSPRAVVVGDGTGSAPVIATLASACGDTPLFRVDESHTSELARIRFMAETPPQGLRRLLPSFLRTPEAPYDDYVAVILAERWIADNPVYPVGR